jgi:hypothetical protein
MKCRYMKYDEEWGGGTCLHPSNIEYITEYNGTTETYTQDPKEKNEGGSCQHFTYSRWNPDTITLIKCIPGALMILAAIGGVVFTVIHNVTR